MELTLRDVLRAMVTGDGEALRDPLWQAAALAAVDAELAPAAVPPAAQAPAPTTTMASAAVPSWGT